MKTSNKILLSFSIVPFIIAVMMIFSMRAILKNKTGPVLLNSKQINFEKRDLDLKNFKNITAEGIWSINLTYGDHFKVELEAPANRMREITVNKAGDTLRLSSNKNSFSIHNRPRINITLPSISRLDLTGLSDIYFSEFKNPRIFIHMNGVTAISGKSGDIDQFSLTGNGVLNIDMHDMQVTNTHFDFNGIYIINMLMNGGELSGQLKGFGRMFVSGNISRKTINVENPNNLIISKKWP